MRRLFLFFKSSIVTVTLAVAVLGAIAGIFFPIREVEALPAYPRLFEQQYEYRPSCSLCHIRVADPQGVGYRKDFMRAGKNLKALGLIAQKDSDGDGVLNLDEIQARSNPGDPLSVPNDPGNWLADVKGRALPTKRLKQLFAEIEKFSATEGKLSDEQIQSVEETLGKPLLDTDRVPTFYFAVSEVDGKLKRIGVASFVSQRGPNGDLTIAVAVNTKSAITKVLLLRHKETEAPAEKIFLQQFAGKTYLDAFKVGKDVIPFQGEEAISQAVATGVRKYLLIARATFARKEW